MSWIAALAVVTLLIAGCRPSTPDVGDVDSGAKGDELTSSADGGEEAPDPPAEESSAPANGNNGDAPSEGPATADVAWTACDGDLECGSVQVPIDYERPSAGMISIAVARRQAGDGDQALGTIFVNPGGPGASGVDFVRNGFQLDPETSASYHLVGFDPRGIGLSGPLGCDVDRTEGSLPDLSPDNTDERQVLDTEARAVVEQCQSTDAELLPHLTTVNVARDLDLLRKAVGDTSLNYFGLSYGTLLAVRYAQLFPETSGRLVLDGVVDPELDLPDLLTQQSEAFEQGFARLASRCESDGPCPPGGLLASFDRVFAALEASDAGNTDDIGSTELVMASLLPVYNPAIWSQYRQALVEAEQGQLANLGRLSDFFAGSISFTSYAAFACADSAHPDGLEAWESFAVGLEQRAPRFGAVIANELRVCSLWPEAAQSSAVPAPDRTNEQLVDNVAPLIIGTDGDAATPFENAANVAARLPASHLVSVSGQRHTAYNGSQCVRSLVAQYFADQLDLPGRSSCDID